MPFLKLFLHNLMPRNFKVVFIERRASSLYIEKVAEVLIYKSETIIDTMPKFQKILHPEKFNLILYYALTSFVVIAIISLVVGWIFPRMEGQALIKRSEE